MKTFFTIQQIKEFENELKSYDNFDSFCFEMGYIKRREGKVLVNMNTLANYNRDKELHVEVMKLRRQRKYMKENNISNFN